MRSSPTLLVEKPDNLGSDSTVLFGRILIAQARVKEVFGYEPSTKEQGTAQADKRSMEIWSTKGTAETVVIVKVEDEVDMLASRTEWSD